MTIVSNLIFSNPKNIYVCTSQVVCSNNKNVSRQIWDIYTQSQKVQNNLQKTHLYVPDQWVNLVIVGF